VSDDIVEELRQHPTTLAHEAADEIERLRAALRIAATAELYDPATGIIDADVLEAVQQAARRALGEAKDE
jgi:hypothetical protein